MRRVLVVTALTTALLATGPGALAVAAADLEPRVQVASPWGKDDTVGDATRPEGDVRRIVVANGRQQVTFTFRMVAKPIWDTQATSRRTLMRFRLDWFGTAAAHDRQITVSWSDGAWRTVVFDGSGGPLCVRQSGGVQILTGNRYRFSIPVGPPCALGVHKLRVAASFDDDLDDSAGDDVRVDRVPNSGGYGPFIRLP
jgi:hypothetical protein